MVTFVTIKDFIGKINESGGGGGGGGGERDSNQQFTKVIIDKITSV